MSRLLTLLLLYQNGYFVGKYISVEKRIEETKDRYYEALEIADAGWYEGTSNPTPFIQYMLQVILACYTDFEERVDMVTVNGYKSSSYDVVRTYAVNIRKVHDLILRTSIILQEQRLPNFYGLSVISVCFLLMLPLGREKKKKSE